MAEIRKSFSRGLIGIPALLLLFFLTSCTQQLYANPPLERLGNFPDLEIYDRASGFFENKPIKPEVHRLAPGSHAGILYFMNALYELSGNSFSREHISQTFFDHGRGGGCRNLELEPNILFCRYSQQSRLFLKSTPSYESKRQVYARGICEMTMFLKYQSQDENIEPLKIYADIGCTTVLTSQPQFEEGIPVKMNQPAGMMVFSSPD